MLPDHLRHDLAHAVLELQLHHRLFDLALDGTALATQIFGRARQAFAHIAELAEHTLNAIARIVQCLAFARRHGLVGAR